MLEEPQRLYLAVRLVRMLLGLQHGHRVKIPLSRKPLKTVIDRFSHPLVRFRSTGTVTCQLVVQSIANWIHVTGPRDPHQQQYDDESPTCKARHTVSSIRV